MTTDRQNLDQQQSVEPTLTQTNSSARPCPDKHQTANASEMSLGFAGRYALSAEKLRQLGLLAGCAFFAMALCYVSLFALYGVVLTPAADANITQKIAYLLAHKTLYNLTYVLGYMVFACLLCVCVYVLDCLFRHAAPTMMKLASLFGYFWVLLLLSTGMIGISGAELLANLNNSEPAAADMIFYSRQLMTDSLGGGIEFIAGVWLVLIGLVSWRQRLFSKTLTIFTLLKGAIGILTLFCADSLLRDLFGITGIVWFIWMGGWLIKGNNSLSVAASR